MHHLIPRSKNGPTTVENGACVCRSCHDWLEQLSEQEREKVNDELREYKRKFKLGVAELTTDGIQQAKVIEFEEPEETIEIPVYDFTEDEYQKYLQERRKRQYKKFEQIDRCK